MESKEESRRNCSLFYCLQLMTFFITSNNLASLGSASTISVQARVVVSLRKGEILIMAKEFSESFYKSKTWQKCRAAYIKSVGGLCENCLKKGIYKPGAIVHHINHITKENVSDATVTLDWSNLMYVCRDCHAREHGTEGRRRYTVNDDGTVTLK